jgi:uncharacterized protein (DUF1778 family)
LSIALTAKDTRLFVRCKTLEKALIEQAAAALGMSVSDYIVSTVIERSLTEVQRRNRIEIMREAFAQLEEFMQTDPEPTPALLENAAHYRQTIDSGMLTVAD